MVGAIHSGSSRITAGLLTLILIAATAAAYALSGSLDYSSLAWNEGDGASAEGENRSWDDSCAGPNDANCAGRCLGPLEHLQVECVFASRFNCCAADSTAGFASTDADGPSLRYYLRRYHDASWGNSLNLSLEMFVEDPSGVDKVVMMSSYGGDVWQNVTMVQDAANPGRYASYLLFPANSSSSLPTYSSGGYQEQVYVKYAANDTLGNWACTQSCTYQVVFSSFHVDGLPIELYDTHDLWYQTGTTGHTVTWAVGSGSPDHYVLREDGHLIEEWSWTGPLTISVDGLSLGSHVFTLIVSQGWAGDADNVTVHVVEQLPAGYSTTTAGPQSGYIQGVLAWGCGLTAASVVAIVIGLVKRRRNTRKNSQNPAILSNPSSED